MFFRHLISLSFASLLFTGVSAQVYNHSRGFIRAPKSEKQTELIESLSNETPVFPVEITRKQRDLLESQYRDRNKATQKFLESNQLISSGILYDYVWNIFNKIVAANPEISPESKLFLVNDATTNAFTLGNNIIFINTGLIYSMESTGELAFVISHELAHNSFHHTDKKILQHVLRLTDKELNDQIAKAARLEYQNVSALNQLLVPKLFEEKETSRKYEIESDSLGAHFMMKAGFDLRQSVSCFEKLQSLEDFKSHPELNINSLMVIPESSTINKKAVTYRESNSLGMSVDTTEYTSYLRSHPYGKQRKQIILSGFNLKDTLQNFSTDSVYDSFRYLANGEIIMHLIGKENLGEAFFYSLQMKRAYPKDEFSTLQLGFISAELAYLKKQRKAGKFMDLQSHQQDRAYDKMVFFLLSLNPTECQELSELILTGATPPENSLPDMCAKTIWAYNKGLYEEYSLRSMVASGFALETEYASYLNDISEIFRISGKAKTIDNKQ